MNRRLKKSIALAKKYHITPKLVSAYTGMGLRTVQYWFALEKAPTSDMQDKLDYIVNVVDREFRT